MVLPVNLRYGDRQWRVVWSTELYGITNQKKVAFVIYFDLQCNKPKVMGNNSNSHL